MTNPRFSVISGAQVGQVLHGQEKRIVELIEATYRQHGTGATVNPPSYFLRFPDRPDARIIALPASLGGESGVDGLKWISSFPANVESGLPRASAVLILNDPATGYPFACLESSIISATRTAASAALAADWLSRERGRPTRVGFVGAGLIARYIHTYLDGIGFAFDTVGVHDVNAGHAEGFRGYLENAGTEASIVLHDRVEDLVRSCDLVVFATVAGAPHVSDRSWFDHSPIVLHVSLRDLAPDVILSATNIVDDVEHCLKAGTSVHLTEQLVANREFLDGTLHDVMTGRVRPPADEPVVFSPFGLGVLDLAVGAHVHHQLRQSGELGHVDGFFHELDRYGKN
ncbi:2,3-diaminopropionate biosynthesis protein SbnB [Amycolatopsis vastitatis]|uniref:2,3-diaminopropionate biosynthesis protein SbnB n=1 Tax=Amycolatopsis vastitatis TaxID=1905142 RepID=A0A229T1N9_9PSEU|nr:2,3-diaminopropionate biosynthesis protein SbnB [Amycolatopsis vastitatis]OXM65196.1 2,3-diaminopropionate biosynthesis protein SbnB [Amycolatopsis vastitatis]